MAEMEDDTVAIPEVLSTHPSSEKRATDLEKLMANVNLNWLYPCYIGRIFLFAKSKMFINILINVAYLWAIHHFKEQRKGILYTYLFL